jgi:hypothetical protein
MTDLKLKHELHCINGNWYWVCPVCGEWLFPHEAGRGKGNQVLTSKGHATKHLIAHDVGYISKKVPINNIISRNQYFCNKCGQSVISMKYLKDMNVAKNITTLPEHKYMCFSCIKIHYEEGLKTKDEVHKGKI